MSSAKAQKILGDVILSVAEAKGQPHYKEIGNELLAKASSQSEIKTPEMPKAKQYKRKTSAPKPKMAR